MTNMLGQFVSLIMRLLRKDSTLREATINQTHLGVLGLPADVGLCGAGLASILLVRDETPLPLPGLDSFYSLFAYGEMRCSVAYSR